MFFICTVGLYALCNIKHSRYAYCVCTVRKLMVTIKFFRIADTTDLKLCPMSKPHETEYMTFINTS